MSGILGFFHKFMPQNNHNDEVMVEEEDQEEKITTTYQTSLLERSNGPSHDDGDSGNSINLNHDHQSDNINDDELPKYTKDPLDYKRWKTERNRILQKFFTKRLFRKHNRNSTDDGDDRTTSEEEDDDSSTSSSSSSSSSSEEEEEEGDIRRRDSGEGEASPLNDDVDGDDGPYSQEPTTTVNHHHHNSNNNNNKQKQKKLKKRDRNRSSSSSSSSRHQQQEIPHLTETVHTVRRVEDIDLYTRQITIDLAMITKIFEIRQTKRFAVTKDIVYKPRCRQVVGGEGGVGGGGGLLPRIANDPLACDGPLSTIYSKSVLNIEISQLDLEEPGPNNNNNNNNPIRNINFNHHHHQSSLPGAHPKTLRVYFYDTYAKTIQQHCLQDYHPKKHILLFHITNLGPNSILPYASSHWYDQQNMLNTVCLCIGGNSTMKITNNDDDDDDDQQQQQQPQRFDNDNLQINIALIDTTTKAKEFREWKFTKNSTSRSSSNDVVVEEVSEDGDDATTFLATKYKQWQIRMGLIGQEDDDEEIEEEKEEQEGVAVRMEVEPPPAILRDNNKENEAMDESTNTNTATRGTNSVTTENKANETETTTANKENESNSLVNQEKENTATTAQGTAATATIATAPTTTKTARGTTPTTATTTTTTAKTTTNITAPAQRERVSAQTARTRRSDERPTEEEPPAKRSKARAKYVRMNELRSLLEQHSKRKARPIINVPRVTAQQPKINNTHEKCEANLFGLVLGFSAPSRTRRGEWQVNVTLSDRQLFGGEEPEASAVTLVIFCKEQKSLPDLRKAGEVLRLHRVVVQEWGGEIQLRGQRSTGYAVYRGGQTFAPEQVAAPGKCTLVEEDGEDFSEVWTWGQDRLNQHPTIKPSEQRTIKQMRQQDDDGKSSTTNQVSEEPPLIGDFTLMISAIIPMPTHRRTGYSPEGFLRVWDGTGVSHSDRYAMSEPTGGYFDPPSEALVAISKIKEGREGRSPLPTPQRLCGRVVNVVVWEKAHWEILSKGNVKIGDFIRLRNVNEGFYEEAGPTGLNCLHIRSNSWLSPLPGNTFEVLELLKNHGHRIAKSHPDFNPASGVLPLDESDQNQAPQQPVPHLRPPAAEKELANRAAPKQTVPRATQRTSTANQPPNERTATETIQKPSQQERPTKKLAAAAPQKPRPQKCSSLQKLMSQPCNSTFKGQVRIDATIPSIRNAAEISKLCPKVKGSSQRSFRFALKLRDEKMAVNAIVSNAVGQKFFQLSAEETCGDKANSVFEVLRSIESRRWDVEIRSVQMKGTKYFLLVSITESASS